MQTKTPDKFLVTFDPPPHRFQPRGLAIARGDFATAWSAVWRTIALNVIEIARGEKAKHQGLRKILDSDGGDGGIRTAGRRRARGQHQAV